MQARSALFDLYGDYLRPRGGRGTIAALVRLLAPLGINGPAVRTAVSRMVQQGWLVPVRLPGGPGYQLTTKAVHRLDDAASRIYRTTPRAWNGYFDLIVLTLPAQRRDRDRLPSVLSYLGYGSLDPTTWVSPRPAPDLAPALAEADVAFERFRAAHTAGTTGAAGLVRRAWDLDGLAAAYDRFVSDAEPVIATPSPTHPNDLGDETAYAARFRLVHAWRGFLFRDPQLPPELLPDPWPGAAAAALFDVHEARLRPAADRFVDRCLAA